MNVLLDRDAPHWARELARLKAVVGACPATAVVAARSAMQGAFIWTCERGKIAGSFLLAPTPTVTLQRFDFEIVKP
jgi:D-alanyl-D-alanine-carboxypeptidase/D-alanyl-D-alanine-endopeptidase